MRRATRLAATGLGVTLFVVAVSAGVLAMTAQRAVAAGALADAPIGCLARSDSALRSGDLQIGDRILPRVIAWHYKSDGDRASIWHLRHLAAAIGYKLAFDAEERSAMARDLGAHLPDCPPRS